MSQNSYNGRYKCDNCGKFIAKTDTNAVGAQAFSRGFEPNEDQHRCGACSEANPDWGVGPVWYIQRYNLFEATP